MSLPHLKLETPVNEKVLQYAPNSPERYELQVSLKKLKSSTLNIPMVINGKNIFTSNKLAIRPPHEKKHILGYYSKGDKQHVSKAITAALAAKKAWETMSWENRANIFMKAADLLSNKYRFKMNAATMLGQSKNCFQAEIDSACELIDFLSFNVYFLNQIYAQQPISTPQYHNRLDYRPLEGFVLAITPFNFTAIGGNLPTSAAMCGNVVVWKPAETQIYSAFIFMQILQEAGLPDGVINLVYAAGKDVGDVCTSHKDFAGLHFTGSTQTFNFLWLEIAKNLAKYVSYPRIVGETGGKNFVLVHKNSNIDVVVTSLIRGAFEYQGQKCSAASRAYLPASLSSKILASLVEKTKQLNMGSVENFENFVNAVIDEKSFDSIAKYIDYCKKNPKCKILCGGNYDKSEGYFIQPTIILTTDAKFKLMCDEIFGPVLTIYVYKDQDFEKVLELINNTSPYSLTGAIISNDRSVVEKVTETLKYAAGNFYINDKPTGAVVGQQPFGGGRVSGTNDKAGSILNLYRWLSPRSIKETYNPPQNYEYPFLNK